MKTRIESDPIRPDQSQAVEKLLHLALDALRGPFAYCGMFQRQITAKPSEVVLHAANLTAVDPCRKRAAIFLKGRVCNGCRGRPYAHRCSFQEVMGMRMRWSRPSLPYLGTRRSRCHALVSVRVTMLVPLTYYSLQGLARATKTSITQAICSYRPSKWAKGSSSMATRSLRTAQQLSRDGSVQDGREGGVGRSAFVTGRRGGVR